MSSFKNLDNESYTVKYDTAMPAKEKDIASLVGFQGNENFNNLHYILIYIVLIEKHEVRPNKLLPFSD